MKNKNPEKTYNINKLYVGYIAIQSVVEEIYSYPCDLVYSWKYTPIRLGMFIKTPMGYKHILTDTYYKKASRKTGNQVVIVEKNTTPLVKYDLTLVEKLISNNITNLTKDQIKKLEENYTKIFFAQKSKENSK